jgi:copper chaperone CopZ
MTHTLEFTVGGEQTIHCTGCEQRIARALRRLHGIQEVQASARTQRILVRVEPSQINPGQVQAKLEQLGYEVTPEGGSS